MYKIFIFMAGFILLLNSFSYGEAYPEKALQLNHYAIQQMEQQNYQEALFAFTQSCNLNYPPSCFSIPLALDHSNQQAAYYAAKKAVELFMPKIKTYGQTLYMSRIILIYINLFASQNMDVTWFAEQGISMTNNFLNKK